MSENKLSEVHLNRKYVTIIIVLVVLKDKKKISTLKRYPSHSSIWTFSGHKIVLRYKTKNK